MAITDGSPTMTMPVAPTGMMGGGFGGENGWWVILFIILLFGWGRNGYGNNNGSVMDGYVLASDFATVERKLDAVNNGICDSTFALNNSINGGFATAELSRANQQAALMQQLNAMQMQSQECCCENRAAIAQVRYDMATQACDTRNTVQTAARDIVENANANSRAILDFLTQSKLQDLQSANQELRLQASQAAQNNYLISQLRPTPIPSYPSCNPWASGSYTGCCGC
jgi:hypothetical protein|uniref:Uncharacterized protein n=1 Tax=Podoviridae sp. ct5O42 TaxID=2826084 RepID=A0A8D9UH61_9CAUD|nr:MAG TPA: hypothetical protein [Podoviridae sp. ct5O42]